METKNIIKYLKKAIKGVKQAEHDHPKSRISVYIYISEDDADCTVSWSYTPIEAL